MDRALWFLLRLRFRGWVRRTGRSLKTVKGIIAVIAGLLIFASWVPGMIFVPAPTDEQLEQARLYGPLILLVFCVINLLVSSTERAISFNPAEVNFLFPAPLSRRQLLLYKMVTSFLVAVVSSLFLSLVMRRHCASLPQAFIALTLALTFMQLLLMVLSLLVTTIGAHAWNIRRRIGLVVVLIVIGVIAWRQSAEVFAAGWQAGLEAALANPLVQVILFPFTSLIQLATTQQFWPDMVVWSVVCLGINAVLVLLVFSLDSHYLEASANASERLYETLQRVRRGGIAATRFGGRWQSRVGLPQLPRWGGIGPLVWRQTLLALRNPYWLVILGVFTFALSMPIFFQDRDRNALEASQLAIVFVSVVLGLCLFLPFILVFDFRSDLDRMEVLKTLPIPTWRLVLGETLTPMLLMTLMQLVMIVLIPTFAGASVPIVFAVIPFLLPLNLLIFGLENLMFLLFPTRQVGHGPADFHTLGRQALLWMLKLMVLAVMATVAGTAALLSYWLSGHSTVVAACVCWMCMSLMSLAIIPLLCFAFNRFDVARDIPPE